MFQKTDERCSECKNVQIYNVPDKEERQKSFKCSICKAFPVSNSQDTFKCLDCDFHICWNCRKPDIKSESESEIKLNRKKCSQGHSLFFTISIKNPLKDAIICKECKKEIEGEGMYKCPLCEFTKCLRCEFPTFLLRTLCNDFHQLKYEGKSSGNSDKFECNICRHKKPLPRMVCNEGNCNNYTICFDCAASVKGLLTGDLICPKQHKEEVQILITHENFGSDFKYLCNFCLKSKECNKGRWKCNECNFSICSECLLLPSIAKCSICYQDQYNIKHLSCKDVKKNIHDFRACQSCLIKSKFESCPLCEHK